MIKVVMENEDGGEILLTVIEDGNKRLFSLFRSIRSHSPLSAATLLLAKANNITDTCTNKDLLCIFEVGLKITKMMTSKNIIPGQYKLRVKNIEECKIQ